MEDSSKKSARELVTLPPDLAERVEAFRLKTGVVNKSESLKMLIEGGLRRYDTRDDLFERCFAATRKGHSLGDLINSIVADHPLVQSTSLDLDSLVVYLRTAEGEPDERFRYARAQRRWLWECRDHGGDWVLARRTNGNTADDIPQPPPRPAANARSKAELDDDIPF